MLENIELKTLIKRYILEKKLSTINYIENSVSRNSFVYKTNSVDHRCVFFPFGSIRVEMNVYLNQNGELSRTKILKKAKYDFKIKK